MANRYPIGYVIQENGCWDWVGSLSGGVRTSGRPCDRYGCWYRKGRSSRAHRVVFEMLRGPIPDGMHLDHKCRNTACVNPDHLEPVTNRENFLRGNAIGAQNAREGACRRGHPYTEKNVRWRPHKGRQHRVCRRCKNIWDQKRRRVKKAKKALAPLTDRKETTG